MVILLLYHITPFIPLKVRIISTQMALLMCSELSLTEISFSTFVLFYTLLLFFHHNSKSDLLLQETEALHLQHVSTLLWIAAFLCPLSHCLTGVPPSVLLLPCFFLPHSGLSYIMHVKQTDMSESLKCMAVPSLLLHAPWEGGHVSKVLMSRPSWTTISYSKYSL